MAGLQRFDAATPAGIVINTSAEDLLTAGHAPSVVTAAAAAAASRSVEAEMRRRVALVWRGKRASGQSYWTVLQAKGAAVTADEAADRDALASGDAWESAMLDAAKALAAKGDLDAAHADASWPAPPAALLGLIAEPFAL